LWRREKYYKEILWRLSEGGNIKSFYAESAQNKLKFQEKSLKDYKRFFYSEGKIRRKEANVSQINFMLFSRGNNCF